MDDRIYDILLRLEAEGVIQSSLLSTKPLSRKEASRLVLEAERNAKDRSPLIKQWVAILKRRLDAEIKNLEYVKPGDEIYVKYLYSDQVGQELNYNNDGDNYDIGSNFRLGLINRVEFDWFSFYVNPELSFSEDGEELELKKVYGTLNFLGLELEAGKDSQWWGPGNHGSILMSNNAEPLSMLKLTNPHPTLLPWVFSYLGPFRFVFFVTKLEKERAVPEPYLWGLRFNFKPSPYIEIGLQRTALLGGEGRPTNLTTWWNSFTGKGENEFDLQAGDQRAGFDIKLTLPFKTQPLQIYLEAAGEDEAGGIPSRWAYLVGLYLPRVLTFERLGFKAEYTNTTLQNFFSKNTDIPNFWYAHGVYRSGYTFKGNIIGHHLGADAQDLFFELSYLLPRLNGEIRVSYHRIIVNPPGGQKSVQDDASLYVRFDVTEDFYIESRYSFGRLKDIIEEDINLFSLKMTYRF